MSQLWQIRAVVEADSAEDAMAEAGLRLAEAGIRGDAKTEGQAVLSLDVQNGVTTYNHGTRIVELNTIT